jgi:Flp pilus assembly protein TadD
LSRALTYAERAYELDAESSGVSDTLGVLLLDDGQTTRAVRLLRQVSKKDPANLDARYHLSVGLARIGEQSEARSILKQIVALDKPFSRREEAEKLLQTLD